MVTGLDRMALSGSVLCVMMVDGKLSAAPRVISASIGQGDSAPSRISPPPPGGVFRVEARGIPPVCLPYGVLRGPGSRLPVPDPSEGRRETNHGQRHDSYVTRLARQQRVTASQESPGGRE